MKTRRDLLKGGIGLAGIIAAQKCPAFVKGLVAVTQTGIGVKTLGMVEVEWLGSGAKSSSAGAYFALPLPPPPFTFDIELRGLISQQAVYGVFAGSRHYDNSAGNLNSSFEIYPCSFNGIFRMPNPSKYRDLTFGNLPYNQWFEISFRNSIVNINNTTQKAFSNYWNSNNHFPALGIFSLCDLNGKRTTGWVDGRIAYVRYWTDGVLRFDGFPVRFTNENRIQEGAMYDRVSGELFRNPGSGAFIIGPDKE